LNFDFNVISHSLHYRYNALGNKLFSQNLFTYTRASWSEVFWLWSLE